MTNKNNRKKKTIEKNIKLIKKTKRMKKLLLRVKVCDNSSSSKKWFNKNFKYFYKLKIFMSNFELKYTSKIFLLI